LLDGPQCDQGWEHVNMSCYKVVETEPLDMEDAIDACAVDDANLLEIYSNEEMTFLYKVLDHMDTNKYWTGANCLIMVRSLNSRVFFFLTFSRSSHKDYVRTTT